MCNKVIINDATVPKMLSIPP